MGVAPEQFPTAVEAPTPTRPARGIKTSRRTDTSHEDVTLIWHGSSHGMDLKKLSRDCKVLEKALGFEEDDGIVKRNFEVE